MYCRYCGKQLANDAIFCLSCGKPTEGQKMANELSKLVAGARTGDQAAIAALYEKTYAQVFYTVKSMIKDDDTVLDILQDSYIKAFAHLDYFEGDEKFLPWMKQIAANTARDFLKRKKPMLFTDLGSKEQDTLPEKWFVDERSANLPEQAIDQQETARLLREIIDSLPEDQRAVIGMFYYEELSVKQIAAAMGASESTIKSRLLYGRKKMEGKVRDLEKKGTKLYGLAPIPFLLLLLRSQKAYAAELPPNGQILQAVLESTANPSAGATGAKAASSTGKAASFKAGVAAAGTGGFSAAKIVLIVIAAVAVIGAGAFGISRLLLTDSNAGQIEPTAFTEVETSSLGEENAVDKTESSEPAEEPVEEVSPLETALEQYRLIVNQADAYKYDSYDSSTPTGSYRYALVQLHLDDPVPTLLLEQETTDYLYFARVFQYDPDTESVCQPSESLMEGTAQTGGYRGSLGMMADGNGIRITEASSGNGSMTISRATLEGDSIHTAVEYEGNIMDTVPDALGFVEIEWHDVGDLTALDSWNTQESGEVAHSEAAAAEDTLPTDGERIVFTGTIDLYSYEEVVALQGQPDPNAQWTNKNAVYRLIVLDTPQTMELMGEKNLRSGEVKLISVDYAEGLEQYDGQHLIFSIDPYNTYWPGDTSLPLGQPGTRDVHILNERE
jgi:RNA polymerase sigma factor (sigma-70 family)